MLAAQAVEAKPGMQILDACAAPGGKTCLMAERMGTSGRVHAWDVHPHRVALIRAAAMRLGLENVRPAERDARKPADSMKLSMDAVLVDAPCSGLGVIAEKPDIKYRQTEEGLSALPPLQQQILSACAEAVKVGGLLVYATCTILPDENENVVRAFLENHPDFEQDTCDGWLPEALRPQFGGGMLQILPHRVKWTVSLSRACAERARSGVVNAASVPAYTPRLCAEGVFWWTEYSYWASPATSWSAS